MATLTLTVTLRDGALRTFQCDPLLTAGQAASILDPHTSKRREESRGIDMHISAVGARLREYDTAE
jgi:hypothetical protein